MKLLALLSLVLAPLAAFADDPSGRYEGFTINGFRLNAIEYWGHGNYDHGNGVSFGYLTNENEWNRACARTAWTELKRILELDTPEMRALRDARGPTGIYIIISDWTARNEPGVEPAEVWHYNGDDHHRGGLIKFHGHARKTADGSFLCDSPTEALLVKFAVDTKKAIDDSGN